MEVPESHLYQQAQNMIFFQEIKRVQTTDYVGTKGSFYGVAGCQLCSGRNDGKVTALPNPRYAEEWHTFLRAHAHARFVTFCDIGRGRPPDLAKPPRPQADFGLI
jgi:hypothetical protein